MYIITFIFLVCWIAWIYYYSGQITKNILRDSNIEISRNKLFYLSLILTPVISLGIHFLFIYLLESKIFVLPEWSLIFSTLICFILIPFYLPKFIANRMINSS
jgi:magnesium-transporting ATPase (P-type)